jgi:hypothetical protein
LGGPDAKRWAVLLRPSTATAPSLAIRGKSLERQIAPREWRLTPAAEAPVCCGFCLNRRRDSMQPRLMIAFAALALAACSETGPAPQAAAPAPAPATTDVTPDNFKMPSGEGCAGDIARYRAVMDNDLSMGNVNKSVYNQVEKEIAEANAQCAAGHEAQARATIVASRKRHGYPADL